MTRSHLKSALLANLMFAGSLGLLTGCNETEAKQGTTSSSSNNYVAPSSKLTSGTTIDVALGSQLSSETAQVGDTWHGKVTDDVVSGDKVVIPSGSSVTGTVTGARGAKRGERAMLDLAIKSISVHGNNESVSASTEEVVAGSTRARNLGAIAGSAAAGAIIGKAVGDGKNGAVGGIIGGATAAGVVAASKGYQVVLKDGAVMSFTVNQTVSMR
ncbi:MAG: hypothetical protein HOP12_14355 [Candidatus Eisenbacteria bacterium]|uniref:Glycine zipper 2TM domain-containing protein n=1 Tax=Eiseniibacteriota bacterium TaxID=2212470 RepID=A0A849SIW9_UNCEI|nr:hypothetical protein [Candidatus Eisenbacteria bacterium]